MAIVGAFRILVLIGFSAIAAAAQDNADDEYEKWVAMESKAAEDRFGVWKATGTMPEDFIDHAMRGERRDLQERLVAGDRLQEILIRMEIPALDTAVAVHGRFPLETATKDGRDHSTVWRRITADRFEVWTPLAGKLFDGKAKSIGTAKVPRGDGWGREWYGAFLADGRWVTTDLNERDDRLTMLSAKGKKLWSIAGDKLLPEKAGEDSVPLIAWARADKGGRDWIVAVGADFGRGWLKVAPDGKSAVVDSPWKECFPQQLGKRGFYTALQVMSDDGSTVIHRDEAGHGIAVGWPDYRFPSGKSLVIPDGGRFGILADGKTVYVEAYAGNLGDDGEDRKEERVWFFDIAGKCRHWIPGRHAGASLREDGLWVRLLDNTAARIGREGTVRSRLAFKLDGQPLVPVELHDDLGLGLFLDGEELVLGTWKVLE